MRRILGFLLAVMIFVQACQQVTLAKGCQPQSRPQLIIEINGRVVDFEPKPYIVDGSVMVPARDFGDELGIPVGWNEADHRVIIDDQRGQVIQFNPGSNVVMINETKRRVIDVSTVTVDNRTMVPVRIFAELLSAKATWDAARNTVIIVSRS